jgi:hypothetical protein
MIKEIDPHIHRVELFLRKCHTTELRKKLPKFKQRDSDGREPAYRYMANFPLEGETFTMYYWSETNIPDVKFKVTGPSQAALAALLKRFPQVCMSSVEYAVDFKCKKESVKEVHWLLRRYCYFPGYTGNVAAGGEPFMGVDDERVENSVSYFWNKGCKPNAVKIYERGDDDDRYEKEGGSPWWHVDDAVMVRLEFTFAGPNGSRNFKKWGIKSLRKFLRSPRMVGMLEGRFRFCAFKGSSQLPSEWEDYLERDASGGIESFHNEYLVARAKGLNASQYLADSVLMAPLMKKIEVALVRHDKRWRRKARKALEQYGLDDVDRRAGTNGWLTV